MNRIKFALIGCGRVSPNHIEACVRNSDRLAVVAACDLVRDRIDAVLLGSSMSREDIEKVGRYTDYRELLEVERPDLIAIATDSGSHASIALDCIAAGCNVIVEKPIALSLRDADRMIEAADAEGVVVCPCHQNRFNRSIQRVRRALEKGMFGRLFHGAAHVRWNRGREYYNQAAWRGTWDRDGGALMNQCIHNIDLLRWMMGDEIEEVFAYADNLAHPYIEAEDLGIALIRFANGSYGIIEGTTNVFPKNLEETLYMFGEKGTVKVGGKSVNVIEEWLFSEYDEDPETVKREHSENPPNVYGFGHSPLYADVLSSIQEHRPPYVDDRAGRNALELVLAIYKSARDGMPVKLPLDDFSTMDMAGVL